MNSRNFLILAAIFMAMSLIFSCSSDDGEPSGNSVSTVSCQTSIACVEISAEACLDLQGHLVQSCGISSPSSSSLVNNSSSSSVGSSSADDGNSGTFVDSRDSKSYKWVKIGSQVWMAENLNFNALGSKCGDVDNQLKDGNTSTCDTYGRLYDWSTAMAGSESSDATPSGVKGVCPQGWHLPSDDEWGDLITEVGGASTVGTKLKSANLWAAGGTTGTDDFGFSALPGGYGYSDGYFYDAGLYGYWWSATQYDASGAWYRDMYYDIEGVYRFNFDKSNLYSVRCLRD